MVGSNEAGVFIGGLKERRKNKRMIEVKDEREKESWAADEF